MSEDEEVKRYKYQQSYHSQIWPDAEGEYVKYEDHAEALREQRRRTLEEAAKVADCKIYKTGDPNEVCRLIASAIRKLIGEGK